MLLMTESSIVNKVIMYYLLFFIIIVRYQIKLCVGGPIELGARFQNIVCITVGKEW